MELLIFFAEMFNPYPALAFTFEALVSMALVLTNI